MTIGVGGVSLQEALASLEDMAAGIDSIPEPEYHARLSKLQRLMLSQNIDFVYLHAGTNLYYFTGLKWSPSERMVAAIVPAAGDICYIAPRFELDTIRDFWLIPAEICAWEEHESPYILAANIFNGNPQQHPVVLLDEVTPHFIFSGLQRENPNVTFGHAQPLTQSCRSRKTAAEIAIIRRAHEMTLCVHQAAASILKPGIATTEVEKFINKAHQAVGAAGSSFCIVLFGVATSFPHGVKNPQTLMERDWVLVDTGCLLHGYHSDITRSYAFGEPTPDQRHAWNTERDAQIAAFDAAQPGQPCENPDSAARKVLEAAGFGPDYQLPGLPHRTGHGCGLDIHEGPNLVRGEQTLLELGMVFSNEPMLVLPDRFGVRLEDHFFMTDSGPEWLTQPAASVDDPFGLEY